MKNKPQDRERADKEPLKWFAVAPEALTPARRKLMCRYLFCVLWERLKIGFKPLKKSPKYLRDMRKTIEEDYRNF